jgi:hypothetical protein
MKRDSRDLGGGSLPLSRESRRDRHPSPFMEDKVISEIQKELNYLYRAAAEISSDSEQLHNAARRETQGGQDLIVYMQCIHRMLCYTYPSPFLFPLKTFLPLPH